MANEFLSRHSSHRIAVIKHVHVNGNSASPMTQDFILTDHTYFSSIDDWFG